MICVNHLTKLFGKQIAVNDLSFTIQPGEIVGFLGPNGAGKSTTMKMLTGFLPASDGTIVIQGKNLLDEAVSVKKTIGYLPEGAPLYSEMSVYQFLTFIAQARDIPKHRRASAIQRVAEKVDLIDLMNVKIETLSKGFKRRVGIAQAIIHDPDILILDEPTDGLDPNQKHQVRQLIKTLAIDKIVIVSTHILEEVSSVCNRVMIIAKGILKFDGTPEALLSQSRYHNAVSIRLKQIADISGLLELEGVQDFYYCKDTKVTTVFPLPGHTVVEQVSAFIYQNKLPIHSFAEERGRLDEVFRDITSEASESP